METLQPLWVCTRFSSPASAGAKVPKQERCFALLLSLQQNRSALGGGVRSLKYLPEPLAEPSLARADDAVGSAGEIKTGLAMRQDFALWNIWARGGF